MENVLKLPSQQSLFDAKNRLVDLVIPANSGVYDLSQSYVAIDCSVTGLELDLTEAGDGALVVGGTPVAAADAVADVRLGLKHNATAATIYDNTSVPVSALVRNASMFSAARGKVEDIRRSDVLRATMKAYTDDIEDIEARALGGLAHQAKSNPWASGAFAQLVGIGATSSGYKNHELRIMLKDVFNIGAVEEWDSAKMGDTKIHLELNLNLVELQQVLGAADAAWARYYHNQNPGTTPTPSGPANITYKQASTLTFVNGAAAATSTSIEMAAEYASLEDSPFWTNQMVKVTTTITGGATSTPAIVPATASVKYAVIKSISWDKDTRKITLEFGGVVLSTGVISVANAVIARDVEGMTVTAASKTAALAFETVELTAVKRTDMDSGSDQVQYTQFMTQSDQFTNASTLNRSYFVPAQTQTAYIVLPSQAGGDFSSILGCARVGEYRFTVNGESVTNRAVPYMTTPAVAAAADSKAERGSSLHYSLVSEALMNSGIRYHSLRESVFDQIIPASIDIPVTGTGDYGWTNLTDAPEKACYMLALPIPVSNTPTQITIELEGSFPGNFGELYIFSEIRSVL